MDDIFKKTNILSCTPEDEKYPHGFRNLVQIPQILYYMGAIDIINCNKNIAVIGSRKCSEAGIRLSYETGRVLGAHGVNVVNGLALGCDTEALRGALSVDGKCVAIMPCGLDEIQPKSNQKLADEILKKGGCIISEYPVGTGIKKYQYVERDRLQSGVSQGVVVIEAERESGTMHTADFAMRQYKRLACYYHALLEHSSGNHYLEQNGKTQVLQSANDVIEFVNSISFEDTYQQMSLF